MAEFRFPQQSNGRCFPTLLPSTDAAFFFSSARVALCVFPAIVPRPLQKTLSVAPRIAGTGLYFNLPLHVNVTHVTNDE
jgi:hypothetical protein